MYKVKGPRYLSMKRNLETAKCSARLALVAMEDKRFSQYDMRIEITEINEKTWESHPVCSLFLHDNQLITTDPSGRILHTQLWQRKKN